MKNSPLKLYLINERPNVTCCQKATGPKTFANILLAGPCNLKCNFCFGHDNSVAAKSWNVLKTPVNELKNINSFLSAMKDDNIESIVITGTNTDPTLYQDLDALIDKIWDYDLKPAMITNGFLAIGKIKTINRLQKVTYSLHTLDKETSLILLGKSEIPDWSMIFRETKISFKVNVVICNENKNQILQIIDFCKNAGVKRISLRDSLGYRTDRSYLGEPTKWYAGNPIYLKDGMEITAWNAESLETNSWNWIPNGQVFEQKRLYEVLTGKDKNPPDLLL